MKITVMQKIGILVNFIIRDLKFCEPVFLVKGNLRELRGFNFQSILALYFNVQTCLWHCVTYLNPNGLYPVPHHLKVLICLHVFELFFLSGYTQVINFQKVLFTMLSNNWQHVFSTQANFGLKETPFFQFLTRINHIWFMKYWCTEYKI